MSAAQREFPKLDLAFTNENAALATQFLEALGGGPDGVFTFQTFPDRDKGEPPPAHGDPRSRILTGTFRQYAKILAELNRARAGVFVTVNPQRGNWRANANTIRPRAVFHENDGALKDNVAHLWPIEPSMIVRTRDNHSHIYWFLDNTVGTPEERALWEAIERHLVEKRGSDRQCQKYCQVLRLPGFYHTKNPDTPRLVTIAKPYNGARYTLEEMALAFPPLEAPRIIEQEVSQHELEQNGIADLPVVSEVQWSDIRKMLDYINPDAPVYPNEGDGGEGTRKRWLNVLMALEETKHPDRVLVADEWSRCGGLRDRVFPVGGEVLQHRGYVEDEPAYQMGTFKRNTGPKIGLGTLIRYAKEGGWPGWTKDGEEEIDFDAADRATLVDTFMITGGDEALARTPPPQDFLLDGFISGSDTMSALLGRGGAGKSKFVNGIAAAVASGTPAFGYMPLMPAVVGACVIVDIENEPDEFTRRFQDHVRAMVEHNVIRPEQAPELFKNIQHVYINRMSWPLVITSHGTPVRHSRNFERLYDELSRARDRCPTKPRWAVFDALYKFHTAEENSQSHMLMVMEQLNELSHKVFGKIPRSFVHHASKGNAATSHLNDTGGTSRGASSIEAAVRSSVTIRGLTKEEAKMMGIGETQHRDFARIFVGKSNYRVMKPDWFNVRSFGGAWWHTGREPASMAPEDRMSYEAFIVRLYDLMVRKGLDVTVTSAGRAYSKALGGTRAQLDSWLGMAEIDGYIRKHGRGKLTWIASIADLPVVTPDDANTEALM